MNQTIASVLRKKRKHIFRYGRFHEIVLRSQDNSPPIHLDAPGVERRMHVEYDMAQSLDGTFVLEQSDCGFHRLGGFLQIVIRMNCRSWSAWPSHHINSICKERQTDRLC